MMQAIDFTSKLVSKRRYIHLIIKILICLKTLNCQRADFLSITCTNRLLVYINKVHV